MREILFRGKAINRDYGCHRTNYKNGDWVYGLVTRLYDERFENLPAEMTNVNGIEGIEVDYKTIGQYTGLTDKNGKKICEGDIIRYSDSGEYEMYLESLECPEEYDGINFENMWTIDEVVYGIAINYPAFDLNRHDWEVNGLSNLSESGCYFYEVIGNIHDNPELLKVGDENDT